MCWGRIALVALAVASCNRAPAEERFPTLLPNAEYLPGADRIDPQRYVNALSGCIRIRYQFAPPDSAIAGVPPYMTGLFAEPQERIALTRDRANGRTWRMPAWQTFVVRSDSAQGEANPEDDEPFWYVGPGGSVWIERTLQFDRVHMAIDFSTRPIVGIGHYHPDPFFLGVWGFTLEAERIECTRGSGA